MLPPLQKIELVFNDFYTFRSKELDALHNRERGCGDNLRKLFSDFFSKEFSIGLQFIRNCGYSGTFIREFQKCFEYNAEFKQGSFVYLDTYKTSNSELEGMTPENDLIVFGFAGEKLVISQMFGSFIKVKETEESTDNVKDRKVTQRFYHISRFRRVEIAKQKSQRRFEGFVQRRERKTMTPSNANLFSTNFIFYQLVLYL